MSLDTDFAENILGNRVIQFLDRQETQFPHLMRLSMDFSFCVLEQLHNNTEQPEHTFTLVTNDYRTTDEAPITPSFDSLMELNEYVGENMVEILHDYLFGFVEDDIQQAAQA